MGYMGDGGVFVCFYTPNLYRPSGLGVEIVQSFIVYHQTNVTYYFHSTLYHIKYIYVCIQSNSQQQYISRSKSFIHTHTHVAMF